MRIEIKHTRDKNGIDEFDDAILYLRLDKKSMSVDFNDKQSQIHIKGFTKSYIDYFIRRLRRFQEQLDQ